MVRPLFMCWAKANKEAWPETVPQPWPRNPRQNKLLWNALIVGILILVTESQQPVTANPIPSLPCLVNKSQQTFRRRQEEGAVNPEQQVKSTHL